MILCYIILYYGFVRRETLTGSCQGARKGVGQHGGRLRSYVEAPTCGTFTRLCEKMSRASSSLSRLSRLTRLGELSPHLTHIEPSPVFHPCLFAYLRQCRDKRALQTISNSMKPYPSVLYACTCKLRPLMGLFEPRELDEVSNRIPPPIDVF